MLISPIPSLVNINFSKINRKLVIFSQIIKAVRVERICMSDSLFDKAGWTVLGWVGLKYNQDLLTNFSDSSYSSNLISVEIKMLFSSILYI